MSGPPGRFRKGTMPGNVEEPPEREQGRPSSTNTIDKIAPFVWWGLEAVALYLDGTHHEGPSAVARALVMVGQLAILLSGTAAR